MTCRADLLVVGAAIWDAEHLSDSDAIAIGGTRVIGVGRRGDLERLAHPATEIIDVGGRRVVPGLIDSHLHVVRAGLRWGRDVRWDRLSGLEEGLDRITHAAAGREPGEWVAVLGGWHPAQFAEHRPPTKVELDGAAPHHPVYVQRAYAEGFFNRRAADLLEEVPDVDLDAGRVGSTGVAAAMARLSVPGHEEQVAGTRALVAELNRLGLTGAIDAGGFGMTPDRYRALFEVWRDGGLSVRTRLLVGPAGPDGEEEALDGWLRYAHHGFGDDDLRHLGAGEVLVFSAHDMEGVDGRDVTGAVEALASASRRVAERGWPVHVHAILDTSVSAVLDAWEPLSVHHDLPAMRWAITHAEQISPGNLDRVAELGVGITLQHRLSHRTVDSVDSWGETRLRSSPPLGDMVAAGVPLAAGTDGTVASSYNPWSSLHWFVSGRPRDGGTRRAEEHRLSRDQAMRLYTNGGAWFSFEEETRGTLATGSLADLVVLSDDLFTIPEDAIPEIESVLTVVGGRVVHADPALVVAVGAENGKGDRP